MEKYDMDKGYENNRARMAGTIVGDVRLDHTLYGEAFYSMQLSIPRLSGVMDVLPLIVREGCSTSCRRKEIS